MSAPEATKTIQVEPAIEFGNKFYSELNLREPTSGEVDKMDKAVGLRKPMVLVGLISGWPTGAMEQLPISKLTEAGEYCLSFLDIGPKTGES